MKGEGREMPMGAYGSVVSNWVDGGADSEVGSQTQTFRPVEPMA